MRRWRLIIALALAVTALAAAPAAAAPPTEFTVGFTLYDEPNPCQPGQTQDVAFTFHVKELANRNTTVWVIDSYAETTDGYVANGTETQVTNKKWLIDHFNWQNVHPETRNRFSVKGAFKIDLATGEATIEEFSMRCEGRVR